MPDRIIGEMTAGFEELTVDQTPGRSIIQPYMGSDTPNNSDTEGSGFDHSEPLNFDGYDES